MSFQLLDLQTLVSGYGAGVIAALAVIATFSQPSKLDAIPTAGSSGWFSSWWAGIRYLTNPLAVMQEGYEKHKSAPFKVGGLPRWLVVLSNPEHVEEVGKAPEDTLSSTEAVNDQLQAEYTMGPEINHNPCHISVARLQLTRNLGTLYPEIRDEITTVFDDILDFSGNEWKSVPAFRSMQEVVCRTTGRVFVGLPLCRDPDWIDLNIRYTFDVGKGAAIIAPFPLLLKSVVARFFTSVDQSNQRGRKLLGPIIEERLKYLNEYGSEWADKPNDFLSWLMEEAEGPELTVKSLTTRIMFVSFAAIHTSSHVFTLALFYLAANPQYIQTLREEVEAIVEMDGWSKVALGKMRKVDSFLKESHRLDGINGSGVTRKALKDFTFSDGTFIPKGTTITTAVRSIHHDDAYYENAHAFEPFRFAEMHEEEDEGMKYQFASTTTEYVPFGYGRQACPGRFFAAIMLKTMLAHLVVTYDFKLADNATRPQPLRFATITIADPSAQLMFRRRVD